MLWKNTTAYAPASRIAFSTPCITPPNMVVVGSRGTNGAIRGFEKASGRNVASAIPANGGGTSGTIALRNGTVVFTNTGEYGYGIMLPDASLTWAPVPTAYTFAPDKNLSAGRCQPCVDAANCVYLPGAVAGTGSWNIASFDCSQLSASAKKTPKWSVSLPDGFMQTGASLSADGKTLYIVADKALPSVVYALNTANGATRWSYTLDAGSNSIPAVDNLGQIHLCTLSGDYVVLSDAGEVRYKKRLADSIDGSPSISEWGYSYFIGKDTASGKSFGLFGANAGTIRNLGVEGTLSTDFEIAGGIVGTNTGLIDGVSFKGNITGSANAKTIGGLVGLNKGVIANCANLGGTLKTAAPKDPNMGGIVGQIAKGDNGKGNYVINSYSWIDKLEALHNDIGGVAGIVSDDSFIVNCYSTVSDITAGSSYASVVGYSKMGNLQNIYGNSACPSKSAANSAVGSDKAAGTVYKATTFRLLSLDNMRSGAVVVPSSKAECADFTAALNAGVEIFNATPAQTLPAKPEVTLRQWVASESYPVLAD